MRLYRMAQTLVVLATLGLALPAAAQGETKEQVPMGPGMMGQGTMGQGMHSGQGMGRGGLMTMGMMGGCPMMGMMAEGGAEVMAERRIVYLKEELGIKKSQTQAWDAFAAAMRANAQSMMGMRSQMMAQMGEGTPGAAQMLDTHIAMMENRLEAMKTLKPAMDELYQSLSSKQRKKADQLMPGVGCMM